MVVVVVVVVVVRLLLLQEALDDLAPLEAPSRLFFAVTVLNLVGLRADDLADARPG